MRKKQDIMWEQSTLWESVEKWVTKYLNADKHSREATAFMSKCAKRIANVRFTSYYTIFY